MPDYQLLVLFALFSCPDSRISMIVGCTLSCIFSTLFSTKHMDLIWRILRIEICWILCLGCIFNLRGRGFMTSWLGWSEVVRTYRYLWSSLTLTRRKEGRYWKTIKLSTTKWTPDSSTNISLFSWTTKTHSSNPRKMNNTHTQCW